MGGSRGGGSVQRARGGQLLLQLVHLLLQIVAFQLPDVGVFLGFPLGGLEGGRLFLDGLQLLVRLAALGLGRVSTLGRGSQLGLQGLHAAVGGAPLAAQLVQLGLQLLQLAVVLQLVLLGLVGQCVHVSQHVIFIKAEQAGTKTLFLNVHRFRRHGFLHPLAKKSLRTLVQDAEQVVKVIAVILFLGRGCGLCGHRRVHAGAEGLGEDRVGHDGVDLRLDRLHRAGPEQRQAVRRAG